MSYLRAGGGSRASLNIYYVFSPQNRHFYLLLFIELIFTIMKLSCACEIWLKAQIKIKITLGLVFCLYIFQNCLPFQFKK